MSPAAPAPSFADRRLQADLERDGFVVVDLLDDGVVTQLNDLFGRLDHPVRSGFFAANETPDVGYKTEMADEIQRLVGPALAQLVPQHRLIGGFFMVKWPGGASAQPAHLDWSLVDERRFRSLSAWIPLVDMSEDNGAMTCVRGSHHQVGTTFRGSPDFPTQSEVQRLTDQIPGTDHHRLDLRRGEAVIYAHQCVHYSGVNATDEVRPAANLALVPDAADLLHYRLREDGAVDRLWVDDGFFEGWRWGSSAPAPLRVETIEREDTLATPRTAPSGSPRLRDRFRRRSGHRP